MEPMATTAKLNPLRFNEGESIEFKLSETFIESPKLNCKQHSLTYTASFETIRLNSKSNIADDLVSPLFHRGNQKKLFMNEEGPSLLSEDNGIISIDLVLHELELHSDAEKQSEMSSPSNSSSHQKSKIFSIKTNNHPHNQNIFKKNNSLLKIQQIRFESDKGEEAKKTLNIVKDSNENTSLNKMLRVKCLKNIHSSEKKELNQPHKKQSLKMFANFIDSPKQLENIKQDKKNTLVVSERKMTKFRMLESLESNKSHYHPKSKSEKKCSEQKVFRRQSNSLKSKNYQVQHVLRKKSNSTSNNSDLIVLAVKASLLDRKADEISNRKSQVYCQSDSKKMKKEYSGKSLLLRSRAKYPQAEQKELTIHCPENNVEESKQAICLQARENIYHRKMLYMR